MLTLTTPRPRLPLPQAILVPALGVAAALLFGGKPLAALAVGLAGGLSLSGSI